MDKSEDHFTDRGLRDRIVDGLAAFAELQERFRKKLELDLLGRCGGADGRSREKAIEIVSEVLADCFTKSPSLLEKWHGEDPLDAFLRTTARNRLKSWWRSRDAATVVDSDSHALTGASGEPSSAAIDWEEMKVAERALEAGVAAAAAGCPEGLVFMRLKGLFGVNQRELSTVWGHHEAQTSRRIKEAMDLIRGTAMDVASEAGMKIDFDTLRVVLQAKPSILFGENQKNPQSPDHAVLGKVAARHGGDTERQLAATMMAGNPDALEYFAGLLKRTSSPGIGHDAGPDFCEAAARITEGVRRHLGRMSPEDVRSLVSPAMAAIFRDSLEWIGADGGTLWWPRSEQRVLEAVFNPLEPEMAGRRQPLVSGVVSLVLATSESICMHHVNSDPRHSPAIDALLGKTTSVMIAVPFKMLGSTHGVLTAVRLGDPQPFRHEARSTMERQAALMAALLQAEMLSQLTGRPPSA